MLGSYLKEAARKRFPTVYDLLLRNIKYSRAKGHSIPCHYYGLFVRNDGSVFPCCQTRNVESLQIGHIEDPEMFPRIKSFGKRCSCDGFNLRRAQPDEKQGYQLLNIEVSLTCQAACTMCCVDAPSWRGHYDHYKSLTKLIEQTKPKILLVQGGEVLVQNKTLEWVSSLRTIYPDMKIYVVTNGNMGCEKLDMVENLFDRVYVSFVGFQPETYKKIMGLDLSRTITFVEKLIERKKTQIYLKYLVTPLNAHEAELFMAWSLSLRAKRVMFEGAGNARYINFDTFDDYWRKIFKRTSKGIKSIIIRNRELLKGDQIRIAFDSEVMSLFEVDDVFIHENGLKANVVTRSQSRLFRPEPDVDFQDWPNDHENVVNRERILSGQNDK